MIDPELWKMFELAAPEFRNFSAIPPADRLSSRRDLCAMMFLDEKQHGTEPMIVTGSWEGFYLSIHPRDLDLTQDDVVYLRRCGVWYDEECFSLVIELFPQPWRKRLPDASGHYMYRMPGIPYVPRKCYATVYADDRPMEITTANGEVINDWTQYEFKGPMSDKEWDFPARDVDEGNRRLSRH